MNLFPDLKKVKLIFYVIFQHEIPNYDGPLVDIMVTTTFWEHQKHHAPVFNKLLNRVPTWAHVVPSVAAVNSYVF